MSGPGIVFLIAVLLIVLALVYFLVSTIVALRKIHAGLDTVIAGVGEILEKTAPVNDVVASINGQLDAGVDLLEGLLVKKAGMTDAMGLVEGAIRVMLPGVDIVSEVTPYAQRLVRSRFSPERVAADAARLILQAQTQRRDMPTHLTQVLTDLESGEIRFITVDPDAQRMRQEIAQGVLRLSLAVLAGTTTLGAFLFLATWSPVVYGIPVFGIFGLAFLAFGTFLFAALGLHVFFAELLRPSWWQARIWAVLRFFRIRRRE